MIWIVQSGSNVLIKTFSVVFSMKREDLAYAIAIYNLFWYVSITVYGMEKEYQSDYFRRL